MELERCKDCRAHAYCTSHQEEKYDRYEKVLLAGLRGKGPLEVNPGPKAAGARLRQVKYNPILFQAVRSSKDCIDSKVETLRYPRLGAFEVWVCYRARREEVFSKLKSQRWPNVDQLLEKVEELAISFGGWSGGDEGDLFLPPPPMPPMPASAPTQTAASKPAPKVSLKRAHSGTGYKHGASHAELCEHIKQRHQAVIAAWRSFDRNGEGTIQRDEFEQGLRNSGLDLPQEQFDELWQLADADGSGLICYQEFAQGLCGVESPGGRSPFQTGARPASPSSGRMPISSASRPTSPSNVGRPKPPSSSGSRPTSPSNVGRPKSPPAVARPKSAGRRPAPVEAAVPTISSARATVSSARAASTSRPSSPSSASPQPGLESGGPEVTEQQRVMSMQKPPLPQDVVYETNAPAIYDKKDSASNFSTVASSTDLRAELREGMHRPLSATSSDLSIRSQLAPVGLSRPVSEGLLAASGVEETVEDKDEYSGCFEASMSHSVVGGVQTPTAAAAVLLESPVPAAPSGMAAVADDHYGEYSAEFEASMSNGVADTRRSLGLQDGAPALVSTSAEPAPLERVAFEQPAQAPGAIGIALQREMPLEHEEEEAEHDDLLRAPALVSTSAEPAAPERVAFQELAQAPGAVGIALQREMPLEQEDLQPTLDRSEYSGFEATGEMAIDSGALAVLDGPPEPVVAKTASDHKSVEEPLSAGGPPQKRVNMEASADDYSEFEDGFEESMG